MITTTGKYITYEPGSYTVTASSHAPNRTLIDLDYPMFGDVVVKCGNRKFDIEVVRKALALVAELDRKVNA